MVTIGGVGDLATGGGGGGGDITLGGTADGLPPWSCLGIFRGGKNPLGGKGGGGGGPGTGGILAGGGNRPLPNAEGSLGGRGGAGGIADER